MRNCRSKIIPLEVSEAWGQVQHLFEGKTPMFRDPPGEMPRDGLSGRPEVGRLGRARVTVTWGRPLKPQEYKGQSAVP